MKYEEGEECTHGKEQIQPAPERAPSEAHQGEPHDGNHQRARHLENRTYHIGIGPRHVQRRQSHHDHRARQDEEPPSHQSAPEAMHPPADVRGELLRLGARDHLAERQRVKELLLRDPPPPIHDLVMHQGDLTGGAPETQ